MLTRLKNLPRDSRDTLFLLAVIAWVILPQVSNLPIWCSLLVAGVLTWRGTLAVQNKPLPSRWWLLALLIITLAATANTHRTLMGRDAGVTLIVVLLALKTLELRARRDAFVVFFLSFFTMLTNFFFSQSLLTAAAMLIALLGLLTALVNTHMPVGKPPLLQAAKTAGWMTLLGAPVMAVLFMLFPRMAPLWGVPSDAMAGRSGLSANMKVGAIATLALDSSIAMRLRFKGAVPPQSDLYFRGPVLSSFDGREWRVLRSGFPARLLASADLRVSGAAVQYDVTLEPNNRPWLLVLDATLAAPQLPGFQSVMTADLQWLVDRPITDLTRYSVTSYPAFSYGPLQQNVALQDFVALPAGYNPRTLQWAADLRRDPRFANAGAPELVNAVLQRLRTGGYSYTLEPGVYGQHTADEFWFDRKEGFCEHIASSFVILMRALDVPARVVTGYQGGELNGVDGFWVVRNSDAHAWAEVWMDGRGWVRVDPTSSVAPGRTGSFQRLAAQQGLIAGALSGAFSSFSPTLLNSLRNTWEAVNNGWNQWVLNYSENKQLDLLKNIGFDSPSWEDLGYLLIGIIVFVSLCGAVWTLWEKSRHDPWLRLLERATARLQKAGFTLLPNSPPRKVAEQFSAQMAARRVDAAQDRSVEAIRQWFLRLEVWRYSSRSASHPASHSAGHSVPNSAAASAGKISLRELRRDLRQLPWPK
jgi:transglutaminase-like putative cysteine protease